MSSGEVLQRAIQAARAGRKVEARDLLIALVDVDPQNELAWVWLSGLVDSLEDRIIACENVLTINPANEKVRAYLMELQHQHTSYSLRKNIDEAVNLFDRARGHAVRNEVDTALQLARQALEKHPDYEDAWLLIGRISPDIDLQIAALEKASKLNPSNAEAISTLGQARYRKANPLSTAARLEQLGKLDEALKVYQEQAAKAKNSRDFDHIYKQIIRVEGLQTEKIRYVTSSSSITRLTFTWPLLYLSLALVQMGLNPFAHPMLYVWLGFPWVILGSFLLSLAEVRSDHTIWKKLFYEQGDGSASARLATAAAGWFLIILPHVVLILDSLNRLQNLKIPPLPF
jgi:tetratricopeptide (TPR) repeat protein